MNRLSFGAPRARSGATPFAAALIVCALACGGTSNQATVSAKVVDATAVGVAGLTVRLSQTASVATTAPDGTFSLATAIGAQKLSVLDGGNVLLERQVTVSAAGALVEIAGDIAVELPAGRVTQKVAEVLPLPALLVTPPSPASGELVTVTYTASGSAPTQAIFSGNGCGALANGAGTSQYQQSAKAGSAGTCVVELQSKDASGQATSTRTEFTVTPAGLAPPAINIAGGEFIPGQPLTPAGNLSGSTPPAITTLTAPRTLINGGTGRLIIGASAAGGVASIRRIEIAVAGAAGYFAAVPQVDAATGNLFVDMSLDQTFFTSAQNPNARLSGADAPRETVEGRLGSLALGPTLSLTVQVVDANGNVSGRRTAAVATQQVGAGTLQFSLSWDTPTDVDLHVVEPGGREIFFANRASPSGGSLDLDSNAACRIDNVNNENVTWGNAAPPSGNYIVRVDYWSSCGGKPANYVLTVNDCGQVQTFAGTFSAANADQGGLGAGTTIATVPFSQCSASVAAGRATYEDFPQMPTGLSTAARELPIRYGTVEIRRAGDDALLASSATDADGKFSVHFTNTGAHGYYVAIVAQQDNAIVKQKVTDKNAFVYTKKSATVDESATPQKLDFAVKATKADGSGPAFNIFDIGVKGATVVRTRFQSVPPLLTWVWTDSEGGRCDPASCYSGDSISVLSSPADHDEYDDLVLLHEFGHFVQDHYSGKNDIGGRHSFTGQYDPRMAWNEGSATFFGNFAAGTTLYIDTNSGSRPLTLDLKTPPASVPRGTSDGKQTGFLSEVIVAAVMWDLADPISSTAPASTPVDTVTNPDGVFNAMLHLHGFPLDDVSARDPIGVDLVDFLDVWFCIGNGQRGDANTGVEGIVNGIYKFPYDYATNCH